MNALALALSLPTMGGGGGAPSPTEPLIETDTGALFITSDGVEMIIHAQPE